MDGIAERAREVGRLLAQTNEYRALKQANERIGDDRDAVTLLNRLSALQEELARTLQRGEEPTEEQQSEYESALGELQGRSTYQALVAAQSNFDRLMMTVNDEIANGIAAAEQSRIILPS
jgi:cell fate (sporulation/competence/biofilm development) regulator YlbF (YheA/YmcA/DUF963 family)